MSLTIAAVLLYSLDETSWLHRVLCLRPLAALGAVSYGFYLFHDLPREQVIVLLQNHRLPHHLDALAILLLFFVIYLTAWLSFRCFESPFLRLKKRWAPTHRSVSSGEAVPGTT